MKRRSNAPRDMPGVSRSWRDAMSPINSRVRSTTEHFKVTLRTESKSSNSSQSTPRRRGGIRRRILEKNKIEFRNTAMRPRMQPHGARPYFSRLTLRDASTISSHVVSRYIGLPPSLQNKVPTKSRCLPTSQNDVRFARRPP